MLRFDGAINPPEIRPCHQRLTGSPETMKQLSKTDT
jgi:hypothetical protein